MSKEIKQDWIDTIHKAEQILMRLSSQAWDEENWHLDDVSSIASVACSKVIDLIEGEGKRRIYDLETDTFSSFYDPIIPPYDK